MSQQSWRSAVGEIPSLMEGEPNRENALLLAALYVIQERIGEQEVSGARRDGTPSTEPPIASHGQPADDIEDELGGAEKYLKRYAATTDTDYLQMAFDETTHALKFIKAMPDGEEKREYMTRHDQIVEQIRRHGMAV